MHPLRSSVSLHSQLLLTVFVFGTVLLPYAFAATCDSTVHTLVSDSATTVSLSPNSNICFYAKVYVNTSLYNSFQLQVTTVYNGQSQITEKFGSVPSPFGGYDYRIDGYTTSNTRVFELPSNQLQNGYYYFDIKCNPTNINCTLQVEAKLFNDCPLQCSLRGVCNTTSYTCNCGQYYSGYGCENVSISLDQLPAGTNLIGRTFTGLKSYYAVLMDISQANQFTAYIAKRNGSGEIALYILNQYGGSAIGSNTTSAAPVQSVTLSGNQVQNGLTYYVEVTADEVVDYELFFTFATECPQSCFGHGTCNSNTSTCVCTSQYSGDACQEYTSTVLSGAEVTGYVGTGSSIVYNVTALNFDQAGAMVWVMLERNDSTSYSDPNLYISYYPNVSTHSYQRANLTSLPVSSVSLPVSEPTVVYFLVYGYVGGRYRATVTVVPNYTGFPAYGIFLIVFGAVLAIVLVGAFFYYRRTREPQQTGLLTHQLNPHQHNSAALNYNLMNPDA